MGRMLGAYDPDDQLDRPDLNKCPDCGCYFAEDNCPLCGKPCPENMRAGMRVEPKRKKKRASNSSGRVQFIPWYHTWWFILIMMFFMPLIGIILFFTSPYSKKWKIIITSVALAYMVFIYTGLGGFLLRQALTKDPVNTKLSREAYVEKCEEIDAEDFYRTAGRQKGGYYTMTLTVRERVPDAYTDSYWDDSFTVYVCEVVTPGTPGGTPGTVTVLLRDCQIGDGINLMPGDRVRAFGQSAGTRRISAFVDCESVSWNQPCLNVAYAELLPD